MSIALLILRWTGRGAEAMDWIAALIGLIGGFTGGLLGVGGGTIYIPLMIMLKGMDTHRAVGTSLMTIIFTGMFGAFFHHRQGMVDLRIAVAMGIFSILGVWLGTRLSVATDELMLRRIFSVFLVVVAFKLFFTK